MSKKILVAMSGGVDSSVAAYLLKQSGWNVGGATIRTWASGECADKNTKACCGVIGVEDARAVAEKLDIPYYVFNFEKEFKERVVDYFQKEYIEGKTPNPCVACNEHIKFKLFFKRAKALGYDAIATGHYAQLEQLPNDGRKVIAQGLDASKDQSYVLFPLDQTLLNHLELPVGKYKKEKIREIARQIGLKVADKPDSQEICFIPSNDYGAFLERELKLQESAGQIVDKNGKVFGTHKGYYHFTVGQRSGLNIAHTHALYVTQIIPEKNLVVVGSKEDVLGKECDVERINWFIPADAGSRFRAEVKIRSRHKKAWAQVDVKEHQMAHVVFDEPQDAITPGQGCVFYNGGHVLGGGWISRYGTQTS